MHLWYLAWTIWLKTSETYIYNDFALVPYMHHSAQVIRSLVTLSATQC